MMLDGLLAKYCIYIVLSLKIKSINVKLLVILFLLINTKHCGNFTLNGLEKSIDWMKSKIYEDMKVNENLKNQCLK